MAYNYNPDVLHAATVLLAAHVPRFASHDDLLAAIPLAVHAARLLHAEVVRTEQPPRKEQHG